METDPGRRRLRIPWHKMLMNHGYVTPEMLAYDYKGAGTENDPYLVTFLDDDPRDPLQLPSWLRWVFCGAAGYVTFSVAFISSAYISGIRGISTEFDASPESATMGLSLFLIGFVLGPFVWGPTSELFGRQKILVLSTLVHVVFNIAICFSQSLPVLLFLRFLSGAFGAAPLTNCGGVIADSFPPKERGLAITIYALVPLFAPVLGPIMGEYVAGTLGWRWLMGFMALLSVSAVMVTLVLLPETYAPILLHKRAKKLTNCTGRIYVSAMTSKRGSPLNFSLSLATTLSRPFVLAAHEPIITILALYQAVVFGTLYLTFAAFPIMYIDLRGWETEKSGLAFLGILGGILLSVIFEIWDNRRYVKKVDTLEGEAVPPESRLFSCCIGGVSIVTGLFWIAGTADPNVHWMINTAAGIPFGFGIVLVTIGSTNYIVDSYTILASSALAVCICARAVCGAAFPLFVRKLFASIGVYWALSIPAFLSLLYVPFPFILYYYGPKIRARCKYAKEADLTMKTARRAVNERSRLLAEQNGFDG